MPDLQAIAEFSNVKFVESCSVTLAHGITPSQAILRILPQPKNIKKIGNLKLTFGSAKIVLADCLADTASYQFNQSGEVISLTILDRRWQWRYTTISGHYNFKNADGGIFKDTTTGQKPDKKKTLSDCERTPKELMELCLEELGESGYTIRDVPADLRPEVHWDASSAAIELQRLCDMFGVRLILTIGNDILIQAVGKGRSIPGGPVEDYHAALDPVEKPHEIEIHGAPTWYQCDLELEAVGLEKNGDIKLINDLSYKPTTGWHESDPELLEDIQSDQDRMCAIESVYRWYRVKLDGSNKVRTSFGEVEIRLKRQIEIQQAQVYTRKIRGHVQHTPPLVFGQWYDTDAGENVDDDPRDTADPDLTRGVLQSQPTINGADLIVEFPTPVWKNNSSSQALPAVLKLRCAVQLRFDKTGEFYGYRNTRVLDKKSTAANRIYNHPELRLFYGKVQSMPTAINGKELDKLSNEYLRHYEKEYTLDTAETARYAGWLEISPDGAIQSVSWSMDQSGATTTVQRNDDRGTRTTNPYKLRRLYEKYNDAVFKATAAAKDSQRMWNREQDGVTPIQPFLGGPF